MGLHGLEGAEGVDEGGAGVHGHGDAEGFADFLFCGPGFEGGVGMKGDATVTTGGDGYGDGDELADFFAEKRVFGVGGGKGLVTLQRVGRQFGEIGNSFGEFGLKARRAVFATENTGVQRRSNELLCALWTRWIWRSRNTNHRAT